MLRWIAGGRKIQDTLDALEGPLELARVSEVGASALVGRHRGTPVQLRPVRRELVVTADVDGPLPPGLRVSLRAPRAGDVELPLGDPELDGRLAIEAKIPAAALRLLRSPAVHAPLRAFFAHPGAGLVSGTLRIPLEETVGVEAARAAVRDVASLADALSQAARELARAHALEQEQARQQDGSLESARRFVHLATGESESRRIRVEHATLRMRLLRFAVLPGALGGVLAAASLETWAAHVSGHVDLRVTTALIGLAAAFLGVVGTYWLYDCPGCGGRLITPRAPLLWFAPEECPHCRAPLR